MIQWFDGYSTTGTPRIQILGEAGIVGKFGFNDAGAGICMNAIRAERRPLSKLPVHLAMRKALECSSFEVMHMLDHQRVASTFNLVIADSKGRIGTVECSPIGNALIEPVDGIVCHTNHLYAPNYRRK